MTAQVNPLAVIEAAIKRTSPTTHFNERAHLWAAHAAVAELIAFAESVRSMTEHGGRIECVRTKWFNEKATAVLARARGEQT